jgi:hypothetical protein
VGIAGIALCLFAATAVSAEFSSAVSIAAAAVVTARAACAVDALAVAASTGSPFNFGYCSATVIAYRSDLPLVSGGVAGQRTVLRALRQNDVAVLP